jgi:hypothetical protein
MPFFWRGFDFWKIQWGIFDDDQDFITPWGEPLPFACHFPCRIRRSFVATNTKAGRSVAQLRPAFLLVRNLGSFVSSARQRPR